MKLNKLLAVFIVFFSIASVSLASPPGTFVRGNKIVTVGNKAFLLPQYTVANLPTLSSVDAGSLVMVTDGADAEDTTVGGGTDKVIARWTGSGWVNAGDGQAAGSAEVADATVAAAGNGDTTHAYSKDDIHDYLIVDDTDLDATIADEDFTWTGTHDFSSATVTFGLDAGDIPDISSTYLTVATYDAQSVLIAVTDDTPSALTVAEQRVVGRLTGGNVTALTLGVAPGNVAQWPADPAAHTLFGFDNTTNTYIPITIGPGLSFDQPTSTLTASGSDAFTVKVDAGATAGYLGAAYNDGVLRTDGTIVTYADGGDYVTIGVHQLLQDIAGITFAQGDILYFDGSNIVNLGPGLAGQYLKTGGPAANPSWDDPAGSGDVTAVGDSASGASFTEDGTGNTLYFEGTTPNTYEIALTGANPAADVTVTIPAVTGTIMLGPSGLGSDNILVKMDGTGNLVQATGISVDDSNNVTGAASMAVTSYLAIGADAAEAGAIRLSNAEYIMSEASPAGTDVSVIGVDSNEVIQVGASGASGFTVTPAATFSGGIANAGTISAGTWQGTAIADTYVADDITLTNITQITNRSLDNITDGASYQRVAAADVDANGHVNLIQDSDGTGAVQFTGLTATRAITLVDGAQTLANLSSNQTFTGTTAFSGAVTMGAQFNINAQTIASTSDVTIKLGDAAGANKVSITDSGDAEVASIDSDGKLTATSITTVRTTNPQSMYIYEGTGGGSNYRGFVAQNFSADLLFQFPDGDPTANDVMLLGAPSAGVSAMSYGTFSTDNFLVSGGSITIKDLGVSVAEINASGTPDGTTYLRGDGSWQSVSASAGGADTNVQYNSSGSLAGEAAFTYNATNNTLNITQASTNPCITIGDGTYTIGHTPQLYVEGASEFDGTLFADNGITAAANVTSTAFVPTTAANAAGEIGYASNAFSLYANSEDMTLTASANLWTFASGTAATFAFTPAVAFTGAVTLTGGVTSLGAAADLSGAAVTLGTISGAIDAGAATSFEVPNGANPTVSAEGGIAWETDEDGFRVYDGAANRLLGTVIIKSVPILQPDLVQAETDDVLIYHFDARWYPFGVKMLGYTITTSASSSDTYLLEEWDDEAGSTQSTSESIALSTATRAEDDGSLTDSDFAADSYLNVNLDDAQDDISQATITFAFYVKTGD